jgi:selT/selW/selH-like putative selenoprotein
VKGHGGIFEVTVDDDLVFSKKAEHRFPSPGEVESMIAARSA